MSRPLRQDTAISPMTKSERLSDAHHVALIVRFVLHEQGQILRGELVDPQLNDVRRFKTWNGLISALSARLKEERGRG